MALKAGIMGIDIESSEYTRIGSHTEVLEYLNTGIKFFFISLAFGYFVNHLKQRQFRS